MRFIHPVGPSIGPRGFAASFVDEQYSSRMIPCQRAFKDRAIVYPQDQPRILFCGTARDIDQAVMRRNVVLHRLALGRVHKDQADRSDRRLLLGAARRNPIFADECTRAAVSMGKAAGQRIEDPPSHRFARLRKRHHQSERRLAGGVIVGAVNRIDDPAQRIAQPLKQGRIGVRGFLAYDRGFGQQSGQPFGQDQFGFLVGDGHHIVGRLGVDLIGAERLITRHYCAVGGVLHDRSDLRGQGKRQDR